MNKKKSLKEIVKNNKTLVKYYRDILKLKNKYYGQIYNSLQPIDINQERLKNLSKYYSNIISDLQQEASQHKCEWPEITKEKFHKKYKLLSFNGDNLGKAFECEGKIFRGIYPESCSYFKKLWKDGILQALSSKGFLPKIKISKYYTDDYPILLEIERVSISNSSVWTYSMVKDACICLTIIELFLESRGYGLIDGHLNNITFHNGRATFIDIGSFIPYERSFFNQEVVFTGCFRMLFENLGNCILARNLVYDPLNNSIWISPRHYDNYVKEYQYCLREYKKYHKRHSAKLTNIIIDKIFNKNELRPEYIDLLFRYTGKITDNEVYFTTDELICKTFEIILNLNIKFKEVLTIGGIDIEFARKFKRNFSFSHINMLEYNENRCELLYNQMRAKDIDCSIYMYNYLYGGSRDNIEAFKSDIVIAYDVMNNNNAYQHFHVDSIFNSLAKLTRKYVLVTFRPNSSLSKESFEKSWSVFYKTVWCEMVHSASDNEQYIYLGEK